MLRYDLLKTKEQYYSLIIFVSGIIYTFLGYIIGESPILNIFTGYWVISFGLIAYVITTYIKNKNLKHQ